jgi:hypothetical protein
MLLKKPDTDEIGFILRERVPCRPAFLPEVGHDVAAGDGLGFGAEEGYGLADPGLVVAQAAVPHLVRFPALEFVQPAVNLLEGLPEEGDGFLAVFFESGHNGERLV